MEDYSKTRMIDRRQKNTKGIKNRKRNTKPYPRKGSLQLNNTNTSNIQLSNREEKMFTEIALVIIKTRKERQWENCGLRSKK